MGRSHRDHPVPLPSLPRPPGMSPVPLGGTRLHSCPCSGHTSTPASPSWRKDGERKSPGIGRRMLNEATSLSELPSSCPSPFQPVLPAGQGCLIPLRHGQTAAVPPLSQPNPLQEQHQTPASPCNIPDLTGIWSTDSSWREAPPCSRPSRGRMRARLVFPGKQEGELGPTAARSPREAAAAAAVKLWSGTFLNLPVGLSSVFSPCPISSGEHTEL